MITATVGLGAYSSSVAGIPYNSIQKSKLDIFYVLSVRTNSTST